MNNQLTTKQFIQQCETEFLPLVSDETIKFESEAQFAEQILRGNDYATKIAKQNPDSLRDAVINIAAIGISLNPVKKHAYLVPRKGKICLDVSYLGLLHLAMITGSIEFGQSKIVHANDTYANNGIDKPPTHVYNTFGDRGEPVGAYCTVKIFSGAYLTEEMSKEDILKVKKCSESVKSGKGSPWVTHEMEMWRKTVVKRASKYWPTSERLGTAINYLDTTAGEGVAQEKDITPPQADANSIFLGDGGVAQLAEPVVSRLEQYSNEMLQCKTLDELTKVTDQLALIQDMTKEEGDAWQVTYQNKINELNQTGAQ